MTADDTALYSWTEPQWSMLTRDLTQLAHAWLFTGPAGLGKTALATRLAQTLLCSGRGTATEPCGRCRGCQLLAAGNHPDLHVFMSEAGAQQHGGLLGRYAQRYLPDDRKKKDKTSRTIGIDPVRTLIETAQKRPQIAAAKAILLVPAEAMTGNAANSLLKLLEEPPPDNVLVLVSAEPSRLPATIRSRCSELRFTAPPPAAGRAWLAGQGVDQPELTLRLAHGAPLAARDLAGSGFLAARDRLMADAESLAAGQAEPLACAARWKDIGAAPALAWFQVWLGDLAKAATGLDPEMLTNADAGPRLQTLAKQINLNQVLHFLDNVMESRNQADGPLDELLLLEDILIRWTRASRR